MIMMMRLNEMKDVIRDVEKFMYNNNLSEEDVNNILNDYVEDCKYTNYSDYSYYDIICDYIICDIKNIDEELYDYLDDTLDIHFYTFISCDRLYLNICGGYEERILSEIIGRFIEVIV